MSRNIASDEKYVFEVRNNVILALGERSAPKLADGWWFSTNTEPFGPFLTALKALDAAKDASDAMADVYIVASPDPPLLVTDPYEIFPRARTV